ncbi:hypothetical protein IU459_20940 [Nocardia amamiensis]|uniref:Uncharacterized protein n=1 Tax=Nocardia amamiensis TaxID=404578 RepID=A0ABS0CV13_9NOCA|nr:hypothetical protein [Nocardia amamiensis]MBF6299990.1 hypothetical protein [Nocardia amamiensis]
MKRYVRQGAFDAALLDRYVGWLDTRSGRERYADYFAGYSVRLRPQLADLSGVCCPTAIVWGVIETPPAPSPLPRIWRGDYLVPARDPVTTRRLATPSSRLPLGG